jgi:hypothetical protein
VGREGGGKGGGTKAEVDPPWFISFSQLAFSSPPQPNIVRSAAANGQIHKWQKNALSLFARLLPHTNIWRLGSPLKVWKQAAEKRESAYWAFKEAVVVQDAAWESVPSLLRSTFTLAPPSNDTMAWELLLPFG